MFVEFDNDDLCTLLVIGNLRRSKGRDEKVVVERGIPMTVKRRWFEMPFVRLGEVLYAAAGANDATRN